MRSFNADEQVVTRALRTLADESTPSEIGRIPVQMGTGTTDGTPCKGKMQPIDNQVDARSGTVRVRAVFDNADGRLMPGQFARLLMGQPKAEPVLLISERAVGTDQNKKFVMVVDKDSKAEYREVALGVSIEGMRVVTGGYTPANASWSRDCSACVPARWSRPRWWRWVLLLPRPRWRSAAVRSRCFHESTGQISKKQQR